MTTAEQLLLCSIDDYLGPGESRFFSRGFQRASYEVYGIIVTPADSSEPRVTAEANISYPADWSKKQDGIELKPHLSTIDALVLAVQLAELHVAHTYGLSAAQRSTMRLRKVVLLAGNAPQEELQGVALSAILTKTEPRTGEGFRSVYRCVVGALKVRCEIEHPIVSRATGGVEYASLPDALGPGESRFYGEGFKTRSHAIETVRVDMDSLTAGAEVRFTIPATPSFTEGITGDDQPAVSMVDCFVVNLQLAQVLMYELDSLTRETSNTLWMMQTVMTSPDVPSSLTAPTAEPLEVETSIIGKRLLAIRGGTWRSVELQGRLAGIEMRSSFAHELPVNDESPAT